MAQCLLCGSDAVITKQENSSRRIYSCTQCGVYVLSDLAVRAAKSHRHEVTAYLRARRLAGEEGVTLISFENATPDKEYVQLTVEQIVELYPKSFAEQMERALENLARLSTYPGDEVRVESLELAPLFYVKHSTLEALSFVIRAMAKAELVEVNYYGSTFFPCGLIVSPQGWERVAAAAEGKRVRKRLLLVTGAGKRKADVRDCCRLVAEKMGLEYAELSTAPDHEQIGYKHAAAVRGCAVVVCDMSAARPEAYYAAGCAQALGNAVVMLCHKADRERLAVDPMQMPMLIWDSNRELYLQLRNFLTARLP